MDEEYLIFADPDCMYPGNIVRSAQPVDWSSLLQASVQRQRQQHQQKKKQLSSSSSSSNTAITNKSYRTSIQSSSSPSLNNNAEQKVTEDNNNNMNDEDEDEDEQEQEQERDSEELKKSMLKSNSLSDKIDLLLSESTVHLETLKKLSWAGLPRQYRPSCWKLLLGYAPKTAKRRKDTIERKRREYREAVEQHYSPNYDTIYQNSNNNQSGSLSPRQLLQDDDVMIRQIAVDIPRTSPGQKLFQIADIQLALQRILYVWAMRHPASGYVQGMNDLVTPFMYVFLTEYNKDLESDIINASDLSMLSDSKSALADAEADSYWCLTTLLNDIQDYYTFSQPGIQRRVHFLRELVSRVDSQLCNHLEEQGLDFLQFAFRWMNCLLMRELPFSLIIRVWDTYLAETDGFAVFHVYVCAALLVSFSEELQQMEFQDLVMFLQNLPTQNWTEKNIDIILSQAYMWRTIFGQSPSHLQ